MYYNASKTYESCSCTRRLWEYIDEDTIKISDPNGQDYIIGYAYIQATCKTCGKTIQVESDIADNLRDLFERSNPNVSWSTVSAEWKPYVKLTDYEKKGIKSKLTSENQKKIFDFLVEFNKKNRIKKDALQSLISEEFNINQEIATKHLQKIESVILEIKPNFYIIETVTKHGPKI